MTTFLDTPMPFSGTDQGVEISRTYTTEGVHPYDEVTWVRRDVVMTNWRDGTVNFEQRGVEFPDSWSLNAVNIVTSKYFRGAAGSASRESSLRQLLDRVVGTYARAGLEHGYFAGEADAAIFSDELTWMLLHQVFSFNSPVWFNVGTASKAQVSACFILAVNDTMDSILNWYREEGLIFKGGSGAGLNLSRIRSSKELLSSGGTASGPVSFMRGADASAGTIKSGGACIAPWSQVYTTERGPVAVSELAANGEDFTTLSYNPILGRVQATRARAWLSGHKQLVHLVTDKGEFTMSADHPVMLRSGGYKAVGELTEGMSIRPICIDMSQTGYVRVGLQDGTRGRTTVHRLVAQDVMGLDIDGVEVHHVDRDRAHNGPSNLSVHTRGNHLRIHAEQDFAAGIHPLQRFHGVGNHPQVAGEHNGMSGVSGNRTDAYRAKQVAGMHREDVYRSGQVSAARQRMLNKAYEIVNTGGSIDTFDGYFDGRRKLAGKMGYSKSEQLTKIEDRFGSFDAFRDEVRAGNHRVLSVTTTHMSDVYDVEVDNDTPRDKSDRDGHNFLLVPEGERSDCWSGIVTKNTRRAAKMVVLDVDHPDIGEFVATKAREENKIRVLRDAGFDMDLGGADINSVQYQNANNSVRVTDEFMTAVASGGEFGLRARGSGEVIETVDAKTLFRSIATAAWECADPGLQYDGTINDWHTCPESGRISASNPCFTGETLVAVADGRGAVRIDEIAAAGHDVPVYTTNVDGEISVGTLSRTRVTRFDAPIVKITLDDGSTLRVTPDHPMQRRDGTYVDAAQLVCGEQLMPFDSAVGYYGAHLRRASRAGQGWEMQHQLVAGRRRGSGSDGLHVHHRDGDSLNDATTNLVLLPKAEHHQLHASGTHPLATDGTRANRDARIDKLRVTVTGGGNPNHSHGLFDGQGVTTTIPCPQCGVDFTAIARQFTCSLACRDAWHAEHPREQAIACSECGDPFLAGSAAGLYCSAPCQVRARERRRPVFTRECPTCHGHFDTTNAGVRFCSKSCATTTGWDQRGRVCPSSTPCEFCGCGFAPVRAEQRYCDSTCAARHRVQKKVAAPFAHNHRVVSVVADGREDVYDGEVPGSHNFAVVTSMSGDDPRTATLSGVFARQCSEYLHLDNSSCNLASLNLMKFLTDDGGFDAVRFGKAVDLIITAMDISICFADFPTEPIGDTTRRFRQLGIGYANLGALLMATGHAYDSDGGRALAASITSLMTGTAYKRSAELAGVVGPYEGYARNADAHSRVMRKHAAANDLVVTLHTTDTVVHEAATQAWQECLEIGEHNGWRNSQASVLAPTGTIGFMMDCDTTGIEPDFSLVKFKKLVGGGSMQIVNQTVPRALASLGYDAAQVTAIVAHIATKGHVVDAPGLDPEHYAVFDCAMGERPIAAMGHVRMMAAAQPFLSGGISKTVNMSETATVEEVEGIYFDAWKLGIKALAIYRDNCKVGQPLSSGSQGSASSNKTVVAEVAAPAPVSTPTRTRLPRARSGQTVSFAVGGAKGYVTSGCYPNADLGEMFVKMSKQGSTLAGVMDAFSIAVSIALQYGVPLETYVAKFVNMRFEPSGMTDDPDVRIATSVVDYLFRRLALDNLPQSKRADLGIFSVAEREAQVEATDYSSSRSSEVVVALAPDTAVAPVSFAVDAPLCMTCGIGMRRAGSCFVCEGCGSTSGCS